MLLRALARGLAAGAAGTTALNAVTYADMALRARPASDTPEQAVNALLTQSGHQIPGDEADRANRLAGLGPLAGTATGVVVGAAASGLYPLLRRVPTPFGVLAIAATAMAAADGPLIKLGLTDPKTWSPADWLSDVIPHLAYGAVTYTVLTNWKREPSASYS